MGWKRSCVIVLAITACFNLLADDAPTFAHSVNVVTTDAQEVITIASPLYVAEIDTATKMCRSIRYTVRAEDTYHDFPTTHYVRNWWMLESIENSALEADDYTNSGYDRGHLRSLAMSWGSEHWQDVNMTAVIVPELPNLNRGAIKSFEEDIINYARQYGYVNVTIYTFSEVFNASGQARDILPDMPNADEDHVVPSAFRYIVETPEQTITRDFFNY